MEVKYVEDDEDDEREDDEDELEEADARGGRVAGDAASGRMDMGI